jgi:Ankyrin repeats (many copies)
VAGKRRQSVDGALRALFDRIAAGASAEVLRTLKATPELARQSLDEGATRADWSSYFLFQITHGVYAGDTALHVAAAAYQQDVARALLDLGANVSAANRRHARPLHYAVDGAPGASRWDPRAQRAMVELLLDAGADVGAVTKEGTTPLHRAVRNRCAEAVAALLEGGADWRTKNKRGSTPLHLAVQTTGRGGTGAAEAQEQQRAIVELLLAAGARLTDRDARGKTVQQSITSAWIREWLGG